MDHLSFPVSMNKIEVPAHHSYVSPHNLVQTGNLQTFLVSGVIDNLAERSGVLIGILPMSVTWLHIASSSTCGTIAFC